MTLAVNWMQEENNCWNFQGRVLKMKCYNDEAEIPSLFEHMLELYSWHWDGYDGPGYFKTTTEDERMQSWFQRRLTQYHLEVGFHPQVTTDKAGPINSQANSVLALGQQLNSAWKQSNMKRRSVSGGVFGDFKAATCR